MSLMQKASALLFGQKLSRVQIAVVYGQARPGDGVMAEGGRCVCVMPGVVGIERHGFWVPLHMERRCRLYRGLFSFHRQRHGGYPIYGKSGYGSV
jgi:hypothetical protein